MIDFGELRGLAGEIRTFIQMSEDKALALRAVIAGHDVVLGIFPSAEQSVGLHVIKGSELLREIANSTPTPPLPFRTSSRPSRFRRWWLSARAATDRLRASSRQMMTPRAGDC